MLGKFILMCIGLVLFIVGGIVSILSAPSSVQPLSKFTKGSFIVMVVGLILFCLA